MSERSDVVSVDVMYQLLDRDEPGTLRRLVEAGDLPGLGHVLCYGVLLPAGREYGTRDQRRQWIECQRSCKVRHDAARAVLELVRDEVSLVRFVRWVKRRRGYGKLLRRLVAEWHKENS